MQLFSESSLVDLYNSAVEAYPFTTRRQHSTHTIHITHVDWIPFVGVKTLFVKGLAQNEGKEYNPIILFKNVNYGIKENIVQIAASDGKDYTFGRLSEAQTDVMVRCNCLDFGFRFNHYNHLDKSLYGNKRKKYESKGIRGPVNPTESPGLCKHLMALSHILSEAGLFQMV